MCSVKSAMTLRKGLFVVLPPVRTGMTPVVIRTVTHEVNRLEVAVGTTFGDFRDRYERAVPELDAGRLDELVRSGADWDTVLQAAWESAPYDFVHYWRLDATPVMSLAGDRWKCA